MLLTTWLTFLGLTIIATGSPGPGAILALSSGLYYGHKKALFTIAGSLLGLFLLFLITLVGLYALFNESPLFFKALASLGIFYLAYIGFKKWNQKTTSLYKHDDKQKKTLPSPFSLFKEGFLVAISNPKELAEISFNKIIVLGRLPLHVFALLLQSCLPCINAAD